MVIHQKEFVTFVIQLAKHVMDQVNQHAKRVQEIDISILNNA